MGIQAKYYWWQPLNKKQSVYLLRLLLNQEFKKACKRPLVHGIFEDD